MPDYRITVPIQSDPRGHCDRIYTLYVHAAPYSVNLSNFRYVGGYFTFTSNVAISADIRTHLDLEAAP
jgi:hypothetical protein